MGHKLLQSNLNHFREAQDLFLQTLAEGDYSIGVAAEPHHVPKNNPCWAGDTVGSVAITWRWWEDAPTCVFLEAGLHYVAVKWGNIAVVGIYLPPAGILTRFEGWLVEIKACIRRLRPLPTLVAGDFNAWSQAWGSRRTNVRGRTLEE